VRGEPERDVRERDRGERANAERGIARDHGSGAETTTALRPEARQTRPSSSGASCPASHASSGEGLRVSNACSGCDRPASTADVTGASARARSTRRGEAVPLRQDRTQRNEAEAAVRNLKGVAEIHDEISVRNAAMAADLSHQIEKAFKRTAKIDAQHVKVEAVDGTVTLSGTVDPGGARRSARRGLGGARR
jgi:hypothetical protein